MSARALQPPFRPILSMQRLVAQPDDSTEGGWHRWRLRMLLAHDARRLCWFNVHDILRPAVLLLLLLEPLLLLLCLPLLQKVVGGVKSLDRDVGGILHEALGDFLALRRLWQSHRYPLATGIGAAARLLTHSSTRAGLGGRSLRVTFACFFPRRTAGRGARENEHVTHHKR